MTSPTLKNIFPQKERRYNAEGHRLWQETDIFIDF